MRELVERYLRAAKEKDTQALSSIFTEDAVYIEISGVTCNGIAQIRDWFAQLCGGGDVRAWDVRRVIDAGQAGAAEWYFEYQAPGMDTVSYDGVSVIEISDGRIRRWSEYVQAVHKTYPYA